MACRWKIRCHTSKLSSPPKDMIELIISLFFNISTFPGLRNLVHGGTFTGLNKTDVGGTRGLSKASNDNYFIIFSWESLITRAIHQSVH